MTKSERPWGVTLVLGIQAISGFMAILDGKILADIGREAAKMGDSDGNILYAMALAGLTIGILSLVCSVGLWFMTKWSWGATLTIRVLDVVLGVLAAFMGTPNLLGLLISAAIVYYMLQRGTRTSFGVLAAS
ncbi:MAG: hypothetical protein Kow0080_05140 [Candidatus Promineifilaceae bacterium]